MSWKSFKFFDLEEVKDPDTNQPYDKLKVSQTTTRKLFVANWLQLY